MFYYFSKNKNILEKISRGEITINDIKKTREGMFGNEINVAELDQPDKSQGIYDFSLENAKEIWNSIGCTDGSYKPTASNENIWKSEDWGKEVKSYYDESDKINKEHNYYDYEIGQGPEILSTRKNGTVEKVGPIGIKKAMRRCHDASLSEYIFPKVGDRVRIRENNDNTQSKYFTGIVIDAKNKTSSNLSKFVKVIWDFKGEGEVHREDDLKRIKDVKRLKTKGMTVQVNNPDIVEEGNTFGWPNLNWKRHPEKPYESTIPTNWLTEKYDKENVPGTNNSDGFGWYDTKELYKVEICKANTECDYLHCGKRKTEAINDYPITYHCATDSRNDGTSKFHCKSGPAKGAITNYFDEDTMCFRDEKPGIQRSFCKQICGGDETQCEEYSDATKSAIENEYKNNSLNCGAIVYDKVNYNSVSGNMAYLSADEIYTNEELKLKGLKDGKIRSIKILGDDKCTGVLDNGENINGNKNNIDTDSMKFFIKKYGKCVANFFEHINYHGRKSNDIVIEMESTYDNPNLQLKPGTKLDYNIGDFGGLNIRNDDISSYDRRIEGDMKTCEMRAYEHHNWGGKSHNYWGPHHNMHHQGMGDKLSSFKFHNIT